MSEYNIVFAKKDSPLFLNFWKKIEQDYNKLTNIIIKNDSENISLKFGIKRGAKGEKEKLGIILTEAIVVYYKNKYINENLILPEAFNGYKLVLCKSLAVFDKEEDIFCASTILKLESYINVDSFYAFKMSALRTRWQDVCNLFKQNMQYLLKNETMIELVKYLIMQSEPSTENVYVYVTNNFVHLRNKAGDELIEPLNKNINSFADFVACELISLSPPYIVLKYKQNENTELTNILTNLFEDKVVCNA